MMLTGQLRHASLLQYRMMSGIGIFISFSDLGSEVELMDWIDGFSSPANHLISVHFISRGV